MDLSSVFTGGNLARAVREWLTAGGDPNASHPASGQTLLHAAAEMQDAAVIDLLTRTGVRLDAQDEYGQTPLHICVDSELDDQAGEPGATMLPLSRKLLELGADPSIRDRKGRTPGDLARGYGEAAAERFELLVAQTRR